MSGGTTFEIGGNIKKLREFRGYSQEYMAAQLNVSQRTYSNIESDKGKVNKQQIEHIAKILEIDPIQLLTFNDKYIFNTGENHDHSLSQSGMFNTYHISQKAEHELFEKRIEELKEQFEKRIGELKDEITFLRSMLKNKS